MTRKNKSKNRQKRSSPPVPVRKNRTHLPDLFNSVNALPTASGHQVTHVVSWGDTPSSVTTRHSLNTNEIFSDDPRPKGGQAVTSFYITDFIDNDILKNWDYFRFDRVEVYVQALRCPNPIAIQCWTTIDDDDKASLPNNLNSIRERSNHSLTLLTNEHPMKKVASWCPALLQDKSQAQSDQALKRIARGEWHDNKQGGYLEFGTCKQYFVCMNAPQSTEIPSVVVSVRAAISLKGMLVN